MASDLNELNLVNFERHSVNSSNPSSPSVGKDEMLQILDQHKTLNKENNVQVYFTGEKRKKEKKTDKKM